MREDKISKDEFTKTTKEAVLFYYKKYINFNINLILWKVDINYKIKSHVWISRFMGD